jgi:hypothetical protein
VASVNTVTDKYILQAQIDDQTAGDAERITARLAGMTAQGKAWSSTAKEMNDRLGDQAGRFNLAAAQFERVATKYDAVTKAAVALAKAQQELNISQETGARAVEAGYATQQQLDATMAALAKKVSDLATKLGEARAQAQANAEAQDAWNGKIQGGIGAVNAFAQGVADTAQAAKQAQTAFSAWLSGGMSQDAGIQRFNANLKEFIGSLDQLAGKYSPAIAATNEYKAALADLTKLEAYGKLTAEELGAARQAAAEKLAGETTNLAAMAAAIDPLVRAEQAYLTKLQDVEAAVAAGAISRERGNALIAIETAAYQKASEELTGYAAAQRQAKAAIDAENAAWRALAETQAAYLTRTEQLRAKYDEQFAAQVKQRQALAELEEVSERYGLGQQFVADQMAKVIAAMNGSTSAINAQRAAIDPLYRVSMQYDQQLKDIQKTADDGIISQARANVLMDQATEAFAKANAPLKDLAANHQNAGSQAYYQKFATQQAGVQMIQFASQVASGQPVMLSLIQQFHQIIDVMMVTGTGLGALAAALKNMFVDTLGWIGRNPLVAAITAAGAALAYLSYSSEQWLRRQTDVRAALSATRTDYAEMADAVLAASRDVSHATALTQQEAAGVAQAFAAMPGIAGSSLTGLTTMVAGLARVMGTDLPTATKLAQEALRDPAKAALEMASADKPLASMNAVLLDTILHLQQTGKVAEASRLVMEALNKTAATSKEQITPLQKAWEELGQAIHGAADSSKGAWQEIGEAINQGIALAVSNLARLIQGIKDLTQAWSDWLLKHGGSSAQGMIDAQQEAEKKAYEGLYPSKVTGSGGAGTAMTAEQQQQLWATYIGAQPSAVSSAGAIGTMQLMQGTANKWGVNPFIKSDNILGGLQEIQSLWNKFGGSQTQVAGGYVGGPGFDPTNKTVIDYQSKVAAADVSKLPTDTVGLIQYWGRVLHMTDAQIAIGMRIAAVENQGSQVALPGRPNAPASTGATSTSVPTLSPEARQAQYATQGAQNQSQILSTNKAIADQVDLLRQQNALRDQIITGIKAHGGATDADTEALNRANTAIRQIDINIQNLLDPMRQQTLAAQDQAQTASIVSDAERKMAEQRAQIARYNEEHPQFPISQADAMKLMAAQYGVLDAEAQKYVSQAGIQITQTTDMADAWDKSTVAATEQAIANQAVIEAMKTAEPGTQKYHDRLAQLVVVMHNVKDVDAASSVAQMTTASREQAEATLRVAAAWDGSAASLDHLMNLERARATLAPQYFATEADRAAAIQKYAASLDLASAANRVWSQEQSSVQAVTSIATNAFDQLGQSLSDAFLNSSGKAINWGNILKSILASVIAQIVKLGVVAPIINSLFNQNQPTLETGLEVLSRGGGGGGTATGGGGSSMLGNLMSLGKTGYSVYNSLSSGLSSVGTNTLASNVQNFLPFTSAGGAFYGGASSESAMLAADSLAGAYETGSTGAGLAGSLSGSAGTTGAGTIGGFGSAVSTVGLPVAGFTGGFAVGSMAGGALQGALNKTGPAPMIGAGLGAAAGTAIGFMLGGPVGALIGGLIGGTAGGSLGGVIGPHKPSEYSSEVVSAQGGLLSGGQFLSQVDPNAAQEQQAFSQQIAAVNQLLQTYGATIAGQKSWIQLGVNTPGKFVDPSKYADLQTANITGKTALQQFDFTSANPILAQNIAGRSFATIQDLQTYLQNFTQTQAAAKQFLSDTASLLKDLGVVSGSVNDTIKQLNDSYAADKANADALINSGYLNPDQVTQMVKAEGDLAAARDKAILQAERAANQQVQQLDLGRYERRLQAIASMTGFGGDALGAQLVAFDAAAGQQRQQLSQQLVGLYGDTFKTTQYYANEMADLETTLGQERLAIQTQYNQQLLAQQQQLAQQDANETVRYWQAYAQVTGSRADALTAQLYAFDVNANAQRQALDKQLVAMYGATIRATAGYGAEMAVLEKTLGEERLAIQKQANEQITQQATASVTNLQNYVAKLATSNQAPLSPQSQYKLASSQFNAVYGAAAGGDYNSLQNITNYADALLQASSAMYGTGTQYVADFNRVLNSISALASQSPDALTAAVYRAESRSSTQQLVDSLARIRSEVAALRQQIAQGSSAPARLAA